MKKVAYILLAACVAGLSALVPLAVQAADTGLSHSFTDTGRVVLVASRTGIYFDEQQKGSLYCQIKIEDFGVPGGRVDIKWETKGAASAQITPEPGVIAVNVKGWAQIQDVARDTWFVLTAKAADNTKIKCKVHIPSDLVGSGGSSGSSGPGMPPCDEEPPPPCNEPPSYEPPGHPDYEQPESPDYEPPGHPDYHPSDPEPCEQNVPA